MTLEPDMARAKLMLAFKPWSFADENPCWLEGWGVFQLDDGTLRIQRLDDPAACLAFPDGTEPLFEGDEAAFDHVVERATHGSALHLRALAVCEQGD